MNLHILDLFFVIFHTSWIVFNLLGGLWYRTRKWQLFTLSLTFTSWLIAGYWYGWGYCPLTDWHWQVLRKMGQNQLPASYVQYLLQRLFGLSVEPFWADVLTVGLAVLAFLSAVILEVRHQRSQGKVK